MRAYVLIEVRPGIIREVAHQIRRLEGVRRADVTFGPYDVVVEIEVEDLAALGDLVDRQIQPIPGVQDTLTCLVVEFG